MYSVEEDEDTTSSTSETTEDNVETVKTTGGGGDGCEASQAPLLLQTIVNASGVVSKNEDNDISNEEDEADIDEYFNDLFPDRNRLDTVEEVTEPMSSYHQSLPLDMADAAKISGQPSSDFAGHESLPPDYNSGKNSMMSVTSREEMYSVSEVEVLATTWPPPHLTSSSSTQRTLEEETMTMELSTKGKE